MRWAAGAFFLVSCCLSCAAPIALLSVEPEAYDVNVVTKESSCPEVDALLAESIAHLAASTWGMSAKLGSLDHREVVAEDVAGCGIDRTYSVNLTPRPDGFEGLAGARAVDRCSQRKCEVVFDVVGVLR